MTRTPIRQTILNAATATGQGTPVNVAGFQNVMLQVIALGNPPSFTFNVQGSLADENGTPPTFSSTINENNPWAYVACFDYIDPTTVIPGGTGVTINSGTKIIKNLLVNVDGLTWLDVIITSYTGGNLTIVMYATTNE